MMGLRLAFELCTGFKVGYCFLVRAPTCLEFKEHTFESAAFLVPDPITFTFDSSLGTISVKRWISIRTILDPAHTPTPVDEWIIGIGGTVVFTYYLV